MTLKRGMYTHYIIIICKNDNSTHIVNYSPLYKVNQNRIMILMKKYPILLLTLFILGVRTSIFITNGDEQLVNLAYYQETDLLRI